MALYWQLFVSFVQIGLFSFGGGYAALSLIQQQIVVGHGWLTMEMFADLLTISEMTPGPIALNAATFVGLQVAGFGGALVATVALVLPSCVIVSLLAYIYKRYHDLRVMQGILSGIRPAVVAMIASAGLGVLVTAFWPGGLAAGWLGKTDWVALCVFAGSLLILRKWKPNPIWIIAISGAVGLLLYVVGLR